MTQSPDTSNNTNPVISGETNKDAVIGATSPDTSSELREQVKTAIEDIFVYTIEVRLGEDVPALTEDIIKLFQAHTATVELEALGSLIPNYDGVGGIGYQYPDGSRVSVEVRMEQLEDQKGKQI